VADALATLDEDAENVRAWRLYHRVATRFVADTHSGSIVLKNLTADLSPEDFEDVVERLALLYDTLSPPPEPKT
jgi:hypothetical protein